MGGREERWEGGRRERGSGREKKRWKRVEGIVGLGKDGRGRRKEERRTWR